VGPREPLRIKRVGLIELDVVEEIIGFARNLEGAGVQVKVKLVDIDTIDIVIEVDGVIIILIVNLGVLQLFLVQQILLKAICPGHPLR
jgi:hypothetical protein